MCSGRVHPSFVLRAFELGADGVLVSGCHIGDCHYINANHQTEKRVQRLWRKMARHGLNKDRLRLAWISAAEGLRFSQEISVLKEIVDQVTPEEIEKGVEAFAPKRPKGERSDEEARPVQ